MPRAETNKRVIVYSRFMNKSTGPNSHYEMVAGGIHEEDFSGLKQELENEGYHVHEMCGRVTVNSSIEIGYIGKCPRYMDTHGWASVVKHVPPDCGEDHSKIRAIMEKYKNNHTTSY